MMAAATELFREDGTRHGEHGKRMRADAGDEQRQDGMVVAGEFEGEDNAGERRTHGSRQHGAHADERPDSHSLVRKKISVHRAESAAHHEQWSQYAAGSPRAERDTPD